MLITGATGSFGQAFVERLLTSELERICIYSRDEHKQAEMRERFNNDPIDQDAYHCRRLILYSRRTLDFHLTTI